MKDESDKSDIIVYDTHDDYSVGRSSKSKKTTDTEEKKESPNPNPQYGDNDSTAHLGSLAGRVYDKLTYRTIEGALVTIAKDLSIETNERGVFLAAHIKPGTYRVRVFEDGYMVQSRKGTVVAGETTQLESFHLIPDCLAAEYPDAIIEEEEEALEKEPIEERETELSQEPALMSSSEERPATPAAVVDGKTEEVEAEEIEIVELPEETSSASSDIPIIEDVDREIVLDSELPEPITEEKPVEYYETDVKEVAFSAQEETIEETIEETAQEKIKGEVFQEDLLKPPTEIVPETIIQEKIVQEVHEEQPSFDVSVEKTIEGPTVDEDTHVMIPDSTESVIAAPKESIVQDVSSVDEPAPVHIDTGIAETAQPEEAPKELTGEEAHPKSSWKTWLKKKLKIEVLEEEHSGPPVEVVPEADTQEVIVEEPRKEEPSVDVSLEETAIPVIAAVSESEEIIAEDIFSAGEPPRASAETIIAEATQREEISKELPQEPIIDETPVDTASEEIAREEIREDVLQDELIELHIEAAAEIAAQVMVVEEFHVEALLEPLVEVTSEITAQEEALERAHGKPASEPSMEATREITNQEIALDKANEEESFVDVFASDETVSISVDQIHAPHIAFDSTGAATSAFEERIVADILSIDKLSPLPVETDIAETAQSEMYLGKIPEETSRELSLEETQIELAETEIAEKTVPEEAYKEKLSGPSAKEAAIKSIPIAKYKESSLEPPAKIVSDTTAPEISQPQEISEEALQEPPEEEQQLKLQWWKLRKRKQTRLEGLAADTPIAETQTTVAAAKPTTIFKFASEEKTVIGEESSVEAFSDTLEETAISPKSPRKTSSKNKQTRATEEQSSGPLARDAVEQTGPLPEHPKQPSVSSPEAAPGTTAQEKIAGSTEEQEEPVELAIEEIIKSSTADPALDEILTEIDKQTAPIHAVTAVEGEEEVSKPVTGGRPVEVPDDAFVSLSDEEKAAMLDDHDTVEVAGFVGIVNAQPNPAYKGLPISIAYALKNIACDHPDDFMLRITVTSPDTGAINETFETQVTCIKGTFSMGGFVIFTTSYETSMYRLTMQIASKKTKISHVLTDIPFEIKSIF